MYHENELILVTERIVKQEQLFITFRINENHTLFEEHFPNFPILPASYLINFLLNSLVFLESAKFHKAQINKCQLLFTPKIKNLNISLIKALMPNHKYLARINLSTKDDSIVFAILQNGRRYATGNFLIEDE